MIPIIDTHEHLWDLTRFRLPWLDGGGALAHDHLPLDYDAATSGLNVVKTIYMEVDVDPAQHLDEAQYVVGLCKDPSNRMAGAVIGGRPADLDFAAYAGRFQGNPWVKGMRQVLHGGAERGYCLQESFVQGVQLLGTLGLRFDLCLRSDELEDGASLVALCPNTMFVLDHCGNANVQSEERSVWSGGIAEVAKRDNVVCKISGIIASAKPGDWRAEQLAPIVERCAEAFGADRVMFASDWPVCTQVASLAEWVNALLAITAEWSETERLKLFHDNAVRFYGLESA